LSTGDNATPHSWRPDDRLLPLEEAMRVGAAAGDLIDRGRASDLAEMQAWGEERTIRAAVLRYMLIDDKWLVDVKGIRLRGVRISGYLDLEAATLRYPLFLENCYFDTARPVSLDYATVSQLTFTRCHMPGLTGLKLSARELDLSGSILTGPLVAQGADIAGNLNCCAVQLAGHDDGGYSLIADGMKAGNVLLNRGFNRRFAADGAVRLPGADITGQLNCQGAKLTGLYTNGIAFLADGIKLGGNLILNEAEASDGAVRLPHADIGGQLNCQDAKLTGEDGEHYALQAEVMRVGGHLLLDRLSAAGAVRLSDADIAGQLNCRHAQLNGRDGDGNALFAAGMKVRGPVLMEWASTSKGAVRLSGARISGSLACRDANMNGQDPLGYALIADGVEVSGRVYLDGKFGAAGTILLRSARVGESLGLIPAALAGEDKVALDAANAQIKDQLVWKPAKQVTGEVSLEGASVGQLVDAWSSGRPNGFWPTEGRLHLDGFTYGSLGGFDGSPAAEVEQRLDWIRSQYKHSDTGWQGFVTQPYEQLSAFYRRTGQDSWARKVAITRRTDLRKYGGLDRPSRIGNWLFDFSIRYGYEPRRAAGGLVIIFISFLIISICAQHHHVIVPVGELVGVHPTPAATRCTSSYPCFNPVGYTIDAVVPIINVHQASNWGFDESAQWGWLWISGSYFLIVLGWAAVTLLVVGYTGLIRRD
jgi:hypothetical protein